VKKSQKKTSPLSFLKWQTPLKCQSLRRNSQQLQGDQFLQRRNCHS